MRCEQVQAGGAHTSGLCEPATSALRPSHAASQSSLLRAAVLAMSYASFLLAALAGRARTDWHASVTRLPTSLPPAK